MRHILAEYCASITELKANPNAVLEQANNQPVAILSHNSPRAYLVPVEAFEQMQQQLDDYALLIKAHERLDDESIPVSIKELLPNHE